MAGVRPDKPDLSASSVSIGLPVYNGARFLAPALDSLLAQTYRDFELIISDNASNDETPAICAEYGRRDPRIRYIRQPVNLGAPRNWSFVVTVAQGEYFKWASGSDMCAPDLLERCVAVLSAQHQAVLCYGRTFLVDEETGRRELYADDVAIDGKRPSDRFGQLLRTLRLNNAQSGLIRMAALRQTGLDRPYPAGDVPLMGELALRGTFVLLPDVLLYRRMGRQTFSRELAGAAYAAFYGSSAPSAVNILRRSFDHAIGILRAPIGLRDQWRSFAHLAHSAWWEVCGAWRDARSTQGA